MGKLYKTMQGVEFDLEKFISKNETTPAIGNLNVNARGDELGPGGKIIRKREEIVAEYYDDNPKAKPRRKIIETSIAEEISDNNEISEISNKNFLETKNKKDSK